MPLVSRFRLMQRNPNLLRLQGSLFVVYLNGVKILSIRYIYLYRRRNARVAFSCKETLIDGGFGWR